MKESVSYTTKPKQHTSFARHLIVGTGVLLLVIVLVLFGTLLLFMPVDGLTALHYAIAGFALVLGGLLSLKPEPRTNYFISGACIALGLYSFARAAGWIETPLVMRGLGMLNWVAAAVVAYVGLLSQKQHS